MATDTSSILNKVLSEDQLAQVPVSVQKILVIFIEEKIEEIIKSKALLETKRTEIEKNVETIKSERETFKEKYEDTQRKLEGASSTIDELEKQVSDLSGEVLKLRDTCNRLEFSTAEFRRQRDSAVDERDGLLKMLDRRNAEIERLQTDIKSLTTQLSAAVSAKCEALAKVEEVTSLKITLDYKERHLEQEKGLLNSQIQNLTEDLNKRTAELQNMRHENTTKTILLETKLSKKSEELRIATENIASLTTTNRNLTIKAEELAEKLKKQYEAELKIQESFNNEILAQTRLADLYKGLNEENNAQVEELKRAITELQNLLRNASDQYGELETKFKEAELEHEEILSKKNECIVLLKRDLDSANEILRVKKEESLHREIESLSPSVASASRMLKGGPTVAQMYSQIVNLTDELSIEREENRKLNSYINKIIQEFEDKTPMLQKEREDYDNALETISELTKCNEALMAECKKTRNDIMEIKKAESRLSRENERLRKEVTDLSRQVCFLLKEIEDLRTDSLSSQNQDVSLSDSVNAAEVISKKLITFKNIEEMQANNAKLVNIVRELTEKLEELDSFDPVHVSNLNEKIRNLEENQTELLLQLEKNTRMLESVTRQRDTYKSLCQKLKANLDDDPIPMDQSSTTESDTQNSKSPDDSEKEKHIKTLEETLATTRKELELIKDEYTTYKKEKCDNEKMLLEQIEQLRKEHRELTQINYKITSQSEYNEERFKILKQNTEVYKNQISVLEEKNKAYNSTIIKHEQSIMHLKDEVLNTQTKLSRAEVSLQNLQQECRILRDTEARLLKEKQSFNKESQGQSLLLSNLEMIKASLERSEAEGKIRLESRLDECMRECSALRRRLQEEQDKFRELSSHLERQFQTAQKRVEEEKQQSDLLREELTKTREELSSKALQIEEMNKKLKNSILIGRTSTEEQRCKELQRQLNENLEEMDSLKKQLALAKENIAQYCNIAECAEKELQELVQESTKYKETTESDLKMQKTLIAELREKISELETELSLQSSGQAESMMELKSQVGRLREELKIANEELSVAKNDLDNCRAEIVSLSESVQKAEDKYGREIMLHSSDLQALRTLKEELTRISSELNETRHQKEQAVEALSLNKTNWEEREKLLNSQKIDIEKRLEELNSQNSVLHDQIQELSTQLSILHSQQADSSLNKSLADSSFNKTLSEDESRSSEQLLQIIKYLRKEKDLALTKFEVLQAENIRLKSQYEMIEKELADAQNALATERTGSEVSMVTAAKHAEVLRKVETLNAITDSNKILRDERDALKLQLSELNARATSLEEQLAPLQERNRELTVKAETALSENQAIRAEATRWRQRANYLIEKSNKISPEDWKRLQGERENLVKLLNTEKDAHKKIVEELNTLKQEKLKFEDQVTNLSMQNRNYVKEIKKITEEISTLKQQIGRLSQELIEAREIAAQRTDENTKITEDLASKDVMLTDIRAKETQVRKIAKKYKTQYEELAKEVEEKRKIAEKAQANVSAEISPELQETFREEGRREVEQRIAELEKAHNERLSELNAQVTSSQEENETLKKENSVLRNNETEKDERTKVVLKAAKMKITDLTEERNKVRRELTELKAKLESGEHKKDEMQVARLEKEKADAILEKQQERDRFTREIETLNQRIHQLQRQLGLPPASKPSTSSGSSEKSGSEPPTANIKPMSASHSNSQQQSVTVMPWRGGETPFASIRPMSQLRTVAVLPTSVNAGNSSSSTAVLVPPQQQIVHTTENSSLEVMSSSPTSSHTDYMPATSSASPAVAPIRQVVVPPTQQATIGMSSREEPPSAAESTQDMELETENQQPVIQQQQQAVAMVLPRVEQQSTSSQTQSVEQSTSTSTTVVASSQQASSSNTVTTTQAGHKRPRETEGDISTGSQNEEQNKIQQQAKRSRSQVASQDLCQVGVTESGVEVEYQVPTSSQRDQEDDVVIVLSEDEGEGPDEGEADAGDAEDDGMMMEADDDVPFEENGDGDGEGYEIDTIAYEPEQELVYDDADCQEMEDSEQAGEAEDPNNEVEIIDDSSEVPNQSGSSSNTSAAPEQSGVGGSNGEERGDHKDGECHAETQRSGPQSETISSGSEGGSGVTLSQAAPSMNVFSRNRSTMSLSRQQQTQLLLPHAFEETGDDGIVPSTPTLYVPRHTDGFGEAVSSPHVPSGRFTFNDTSVPTQRSAGIAQVANEGIDDTRIDLSQLDDSGTGRSVPSTPQQVSPQAEQGSMDINSDSGATVEQQQLTQQSEQAQSEGVPTITVTPIVEEVETSELEPICNTAAEENLQQTTAGTSTANIHADGTTPHDQGSFGATAEDQDDTEEILENEEGTDGVSSEGEKPQTVDETEMEEGREAEASESPSSNTRSRSTRGVATARRSSRITFRNRTPHRPTPIVWNPSEHTTRSANSGNPQDISATRGRGLIAENATRGNFNSRHRARRMRQLRSPYGRF